MMIVALTTMMMMVTTMVMILLNVLDDPNEVERWHSMPAQVRTVLVMLQRW